jgi:ribonuclease HIII
MKFKVVRICNSESNTCIPLETIKFDLVATAAKLQEFGFTTETKGLLVLARKDGVEYSIYRTGKLLIHPMKQDDAKDAADKFFLMCVEMPPED